MEDAGFVFTRLTRYESQAQKQFHFGTDLIA